MTTTLKKKSAVKFREPADQTIACQKVRPPSILEKDGKRVLMFNANSRGKQVAWPTTPELFDVVRGNEIGIDNNTPVTGWDFATFRGFFVRVVKGVAEYVDSYPIHLTTRHSTPVDALYLKEISIRVLAGRSIWIDSAPVNLAEKVPFNDNAARELIDAIAATEDFASVKLPHRLRVVETDLSDAGGFIRLTSDYLRVERRI